MKRRAIDSFEWRVIGACAVVWVLLYEWSLHA